MRIIGGRLGGLRLNPPNKLPVRPTTDLAKEALFNILEHQLDWEELDCLDLCCGTGNISFELASRGVQAVDAIDIHMKCLLYIKETCHKHTIENIQVRKADIFTYIGSCKKKYDFIFADPPYDLPKLPQIPQLISDKGLLNEGGLLVVEHPSTRKMVVHPSFTDIRKYGYSSFSFYQN
ncbi:methyltransferase domain-containing protein [Sphingobacterium sp. SGG-5]|uniref:RsmD family RNA methyltransferase n=1 Tax=Sphingobacterium sp. SGG-5 TaxID=2710881 RepID=UPI0013EC1CE7|nr:RsmD family RNA methyltransferase [Sphingobacterium sp. SGG-5]NGM61475.1 methyltransferase domain-containing protein [Sphingobacterium sp. SGG-5]